MSWGESVVRTSSSPPITSSKGQAAVDDVMEVGVSQRCARGNALGGLVAQHLGHQIKPVLVQRGDALQATGCQQGLVLGIYDATPPSIKRLSAGICARNLGCTATCPCPALGCTAINRLSMTSGSIPYSMLLVCILL